MIKTSREYFSTGNYQLMGDESTRRMFIPSGVISSWTPIQAGKIKLFNKCKYKAQTFLNGILAFTFPGCKLLFHFFGDLKTHLRKRRLEIKKTYFLF
jgi:hypothetical protein